MKKLKAWAITGADGIYYGTWMTRRDAIDNHCRGRSWKSCRSEGDRAIRVVVVPAAREEGE